MRSVGEDCCRGAMILWMLVVHLSLNAKVIAFADRVSAVPPWTWMSFFIAPFFFFSGCHHRYDVDLRTVFRKSLVKSAVPYLVFTVFGMAIYFVYAHCTGSVIAWHRIPRECLPTMAWRSNSVLWFLFSLMMVKALYSLTAFGWRKIKTDVSVLEGLIIVCGSVVAWVHLGTRPMIGSASIALGLSFYALGAAVGRRVENTRVSTVLSVVCLIGMVVIQVVSPQMYWHSRNILVLGSHPVNFVYEVMACMVLFGIARKIDECGKRDVLAPLAVLGAHSLVVFASHRPLLNFLFDPLFRGVCLRYSVWTYEVCGLMFVIACAVVLELLCRRYAPWVIGLEANK